MSELRQLLIGWLNWLRAKLTEAGIRMDSDDPKFWDNLFGEAKLEWTRRVERFTIKLGMTATQIATIGRKNWSDQVAVFLGVNPFNSEPWLNKQIEAFTIENVNLIKNIGEQAANQMQALVTTNTIKGTSTKNIAKMIKEQFGYADTRAKLIAVDQTGKFNAALTQIRHEKAGVTKYTWSTSQDQRVRKSHQARDGKEFSYDNPPPDGHAGEPIRCRCTQQPVFTDDMFGV